MRIKNAQRKEKSSDFCLHKKKIYAKINFGTFYCIINLFTLKISIFQLKFSIFTENDECQDRSAACERIEDKSCISPLTQLMCPRTCGLCESAILKSTECLDLSEPEVCEHVKTLRLCAVRIDCALTCELC